MYNVPCSFWWVFGDVYMVTLPATQEPANVILATFIAAVIGSCISTNYSILYKRQQWFLPTYSGTWLSVLSNNVILLWQATTAMPFQCHVSHDVGSRYLHWNGQWNPVLLSIIISKNRASWTRFFRRPSGCRRIWMLRWGNEHLGIKSLFRSFDFNCDKIGWTILQWEW